MFFQSHMGKSGQICTSRPQDFWLQAVNSRHRRDLTTIFWQNFQARIPAQISKRFSMVPFSLDQNIFAFFSQTPEIIPVISCRFEWVGLQLLFIMKDFKFDLGKIKIIPQFFQKIEFRTPKCRKPNLVKKCVPSARHF